MKFRSEFVSNSSSSCFIVKKSNLTDDQEFAIKHHGMDWSILNSKLNKQYGWSDEWSIIDNLEFLIGSTSMDNFDMKTFMQKIGVDMSKVVWEELYLISHTRDRFNNDDYKTFVKCAIDFYNEVMKK